MKVENVEGGMPVAVDNLALLAQKIERCGVLVLVKFIRVLDPQVRLVMHEEESRIGDVDGAVIGLHPPLVRLPVGQRHFAEHHFPALRRLGKNVGVVHQYIRAPHVRRAVVLAVDGVPRGLHEPVVDGMPARNEIDVDLLNALSGDQAERRITRSGNDIEAALVHEGDHFIGRVGRLDPDHASCCLVTQSNSFTVSPRSM